MAPLLFDYSIPFRSRVSTVHITSRDPARALRLTVMAFIAMGRHSSALIDCPLDLGYGIRAKSVGFHPRRYNLLIRKRFSVSKPFSEFIFLFRRNRRGTKWRSDRGMVSINGRLQ